MSYVVNYRTITGEPGWHPVDDVNEAVAFVEHLRNDEGVDDAGIYRLEAVTFEVKQYFKVVLPEGDVASAAPSRPLLSVPEAPPAFARHEAEPVVPAPRWPSEPVAEVGETSRSVDESDDDVTVGNGNPRRGLFGR